MNQKSVRRDRGDAVASGHSARAAASAHSHSGFAPAPLIGALSSAERTESAGCSSSADDGSCFAATRPSPTRAPQRAHSVSAAARRAFAGSRSSGEMQCTRKQRSARAARASDAPPSHTLPRALCQQSESRRDIRSITRRMSRIQERLAKQTNGALVWFERAISFVMNDR